MLSMLCKPKLSSCTTLGHASMTKISTSFTFQSPTNPLSLCLVHANAHLHAIVIFVIVSVTMCCLFPSADASLESDSKSLLKLKESFVGSDALLNWNASQPPCDGDKAAWTGLRCVNGAVTIVQLEGLGLRGLVDVDALAGIPTLRSVSFMNNNLSGAMPNFRQLRALRGIFLSNNQFSGNIPADQFADMWLLKKVWLSQNKFSGPIPASLASSCPRLMELSANHLEQLMIAQLNDLEKHRGNKALCGPPLGAACPKKTSKKKGLNLIIIIVASAIAIVILVATVGTGLMLFKCGATTEHAHDSPNSSKKVTSVEEGNGGHGSTGKQRGNSGTNNDMKGNEMRELVFLTDDRVPFELQDLLKASAEVLGTGSFGSSYKAMLQDGSTVVVKRYREMNNLGTEEFHEYMKKLGRLSHPNLLPLVAYYYRREEKLLVYDYVPNGSLVYLLHGKHTPAFAPLDWPTRLKIVKGVARALAYLYTELPTLVLPHGHLKSSNILIGEDYEPLLTDYALMPVINTQHAMQFMVAYKSPDCSDGLATKKSDVWSLGVLILELLTGKVPKVYLKEGKGGTDLPVWVTSMLTEDRAVDIIDEEMWGTRGGEGEILKLLQIALACCEEDVGRRWSMGEALANIEELKESGGEEDDCSTYGTEGEGSQSHSSRGQSGEGFSIYPMEDQV
ncbi:Pollen receptor-like kinase 1 [Nymphaea thermarum]|nr:Pollen receptor-like kinase 1 [Nymphaea thermarum]